MKKHQDSTNFLPESILIDRKFEMEQLRSYLKQGKSCQIIGAPGIGKTTFLHQFQTESVSWPERYKVSYLSLRSINFQEIGPKRYGPDGFWQDLSNLWIPTATTKHRNDTGHAPLHVDQFLKHLRTSKSRLVLCLDGFDEIPHMDSFRSNFFLDLRDLTYEGLIIVASSRRQISEMMPPYNPTFSFFSAFSVLRLGPFSETQTREYLKLLEHSKYPFTEEERRFIHKLSQGYPLLLRLLSDHLLNLKRNNPEISYFVDYWKDELTEVGNSGKKELRKNL
jgi:hypothetical protein